MFIYSIRGSTVKFLSFVLLFSLLLFSVALSGDGGSVFAVSSATEIDYSGIKDRADRISFMKNYGVEVDADSEEEEAFRMPEDFDRVIVGYNLLQQKQGLDITKYRNKRVTRYTYKVVNYKGEGEVYANLFIYRGRIIACDICSASPEGFVIPLTQVERERLK